MTSTDKHPADAIACYLACAESGAHTPGIHHERRRTTKEKP